MTSGPGTTTTMAGVTWSAAGAAVRALQVQDALALRHVGIAIEEIFRNGSKGPANALHHRPALSL